jgi:hypothetical protein
MNSAQLLRYSNNIALLVDKALAGNLICVWCIVEAVVAGVNLP